MLRVQFDNDSPTALVERVPRTRAATDAGAALPLRGCFYCLRHTPFRTLSGVSGRPRHPLPLGTRRSTLRPHCVVPMFHLQQARPTGGGRKGVEAVTEGVIAAAAPFAKTKRSRDRRDRGRPRKVSLKRKRSPLRCCYCPERTCAELPLAASALRASCAPRNQRILHTFAQLQQAGFASC